jgi:hypothetical protein
MWKEWKDEEVSNVSADHRKNVAEIGDIVLPL